MTITIHEAKANFSRLLRRVEGGEEIVISRAGKPVARLVPDNSQATRRVFGKDRNRLKIPRDFDKPLPASILRDFLS